MSQTPRGSTALIAAVVALGGFLMGFDSAVISGVTSPIKKVFSLSPGELGTVVACLTLSATLAMAIAGPLADRFGRKRVLAVTAMLFSASAVWSALATSFESLVAARLIGGFGVGGALIIAPMYIAEVAPSEKRGRLVSFNQLNIVLGFSAAFFSNYFIEKAMPQVDGAAINDAWRWMLAVEAIPAIIYLFALFIVPNSPRWLAMKGRREEARTVLAWASGEARADEELKEIESNLGAAKNASRPGIGELLHPRMRFVMIVGLGLGFFQQITGINAIFYYSTTIFELAGSGREASLEQAIYVGLVNVVFTVIAMRLIDRAGRKPLLIVGTTLMAAALITTGMAFKNATFQPEGERFENAVSGLPAPAAGALRGMQGETYGDQFAFLDAVNARVADVGDAAAIEEVQGKAQDIAKGALRINGLMVLIAIMAYIAGFAISLGPVMWAMFSEIFPARMRGLAISAAGFFNSAISFMVQKLFPVGLASYGPDMVFFFFGGLAVAALVFSAFVVPETKGKTLEELEAELIGAN
jgi:sugar porter (SP) family MFS transporter